MKKGIRKVGSTVVKIPEFTRFSAIGDPGCDGLGAGIMAIFARALTLSECDFSIVLGDMVPVGNDLFYENVSRFINTVATAPVYALPGNHDTGAYEAHFGKRNYALVSPGTLIVVLDNADRSFSEESVVFLNSVLQSHVRENILLLFHIPPPNSYTGNSVSSEEWAKVSMELEPFRDRVRAVVASHVHSYFRDIVDGYPLLVSGGGGARIEDVNETLSRDQAYHHILEFYYDREGILTWEHCSLDGVIYDRELQDPRLKISLEEAFGRECRAHILYRIAAEDAVAKGYHGVASLFRAAADAEYRHAQNHAGALGLTGTIAANLVSAEEDENREVESMYREFAAYARGKDFGLAAYSFEDARAAEEVHRSLFREARQAVEAGNDIPVANYHTCSSCGYTFRGEKHPGRCPVCGAPGDKILPVPGI